MRDERVSPALSEMLKARTQWDECPAVYFTYSSGESVRFSRLDLPDSYWSGKDPVDVLQSVGKVMMSYRGEGPGLPPDLLGIAFRFEGWGTPPIGPDMDPETKARYDKAASEHAINELPERREARHAMMVDLEANFYWAMQERDSDIDEIDISPDGEPMGRLPDALVRLVFGIKAVAGG